MKKKYTVITGASSGIGFSTAMVFAEKGKNIIALARREEKLQELKGIINEKYKDVDVITISVDLSDMSNVYSTYEDLKEYEIETWINNAGLGNYETIDKQDLVKIEKMMDLNIKTLTIFSSLYISDYIDVQGSTLINVSSAGGYIIVPTAVTYCASKFYVSSFTEGIYRELKQNKSALRVKLLAPAATKTEFGKVANDVKDYDYNKSFGRYHSSMEMASFLHELYMSEKCVGHVSRENFDFELSDPMFSYADKSGVNQKI